MQNFIKHGPKPYSRKLLQRLQEEFKPQLQKSMRSKFRIPDGVDVPTLHNLVCQVTGDCVVPSQKLMDEASKLIVLRTKEYVCRRC